MSGSTWIGKKDADWFTKTNWSPRAVPTSGPVTIDTGGPEVVNNTIDGVMIALAAASASMTVDNATLGPGVTLTDTAGDATVYLNIIGASAFDGALAFGPAITGALFRIDGPATGNPTLTLGTTAQLTAAFGDDVAVSDIGVVNDGVIDIAGGLFQLDSGAGIGGAGTVDIQTGGVFYSNQPVGGQVIDFLDSNGAAELDMLPADFTATIGRFQAGDVIHLEDVTAADSVAYDPALQLLTVSSAGTAVASITITDPIGPLQFQLGATRSGAIVTSSAAAWTWGGGAGDWYQAAGWSNPPGSHPLSGDSVLIAGGTVTIRAADVTTYGTIDTETITLQGAATLQLSGETFGPNNGITVSGADARPTIEVQAGTVTNNGIIAAAAAHGGLTVQLDDGAAFDNSTNGSINDASYASLAFTGSGTLDNDGIIVVQGAINVAAGVAVGGDAGESGIIRLQQGGVATLNGSVSANALIQFGDSTGRLVINDLGGFQGSIINMGGGNSIDLPSAADVTDLQYDSDTDALSFTYDGGTPAHLVIDTTDGQSGFHAAPDSTGGTTITYDPTATLLEPSLPVPLVASPGTMVPLDSLLIQAFGTVPAAFAAYGLSYLDATTLQNFNWSYWNPNQSAATPWYVDGVEQPALPDYPYLPPNPPTTTVAAGGIGGVTIDAGNNISPATYLTVTTGGTAQTPTVETTYYIQVINPAVLSPTAYTGIVNPSDIVASAERLAAYYVGVPNPYDCAFIADAVGAAAGATMPYDDLSTDPDSNVSGGFWRVVYRGSDTDPPVKDWGTLVQPGDVVRMAWDGGNDGQHSTTVLAVNPDGSIEVYDNATGTIAIHAATYWDATLPESITIYRLDPNHQYLIVGTSAPQTLQGSPYNNLFQLNGAGDTITGGTGDNEVQGTGADMVGATVTDFHVGDYFDVTDLAPSLASARYDPETGALDIFSGLTKVATVMLPTGLPGSFSTSPDLTGGTIIVSCFAEGTRILTPRGAVAVEHLTVGETVCTDDGEAFPIRWIGHRSVDCTRHSRPESVRPIRIKAGAFGLGIPQRDLLLSPDHAVFSDGVLIPSKHLVNGASVTQDHAAAITYFHIELDAHRILLAEGLAVESKLPDGDRHLFADGKAMPGKTESISLAWEALGCAPLVVVGAELEAVRRRCSLAAASVGLS